MATVPTAAARPDDDDRDAQIRAALHSGSGGVSGGNVSSDDDIRALFLLFGQAAIPAAHIAETSGAIVDLRCSCCSRHACKIACMLRSALVPKGAVRTAVELDGDAFHSAIEACLVGG
ncbi:hypothetical protein HK405_013615 [Cladochytrium tenue]|nr:hypothetical protein HK405_013615 [Cladochytrium tenue]